MVIPFPAYRPTSWELQLPNYRVITNSWRATEAPEILGSLPEDARLRLRYENITDAEALELLLLWRATAGGYYPLNALPADVAEGIDNVSLANRILSIAPLSWVVAEPPRQESIKSLRSTIDIELKTELRFVPSIALPVVTCPIYSPRADSGCLGGGGGTPVVPGVDGSGQFNPNGVNRVCITAAAADVYQRTTGDFIQVLTTPGPALNNNCYELVGPFNLSVEASVGGSNGGVEWYGGFSYNINTQAGSLRKANLAQVGPASSGNALRNPTFSFTITPVGGNPADYLEYAELLVAPVPNPGGNAYLWPGVLSINVSPPS